MKNAAFILFILSFALSTSLNGQTSQSAQTQNTTPSMMLISPWVNHWKPAPATAKLIDILLPHLPGWKHSLAILTPSKDKNTYLQTLWNPDGFYFEYQEHDLDHHYASDRYDLTLQEITTVFQEYLAGDNSWKKSFKFHQQHFDIDGHHEVFYIDCNPLTRGWSSRR